jgi:hypothetical protein
MIVVLADKTEITITNAQYEKLKPVLLSGSNTMIVLGEMMIQANMVKMVKPGGMTEADIPNFEQKALEAGTRCRGEYSIQCEINNIAQAESKTVSDLNPQGLKWQKLIVDKTWREQVRQQLRAQQPEGWCDYKAGECACEGEYLSTKPRHVGFV